MRSLYLSKLYALCVEKSIGKFAVSPIKYAVWIGKNADGKGIFSMYRDKLVEIVKAKGLTYKKWSELSDVSIDTITRIVHSEIPDKDSPRVATLEVLCKPLGIELWELFYMGDQSLVALQAEISALKAERDNLLTENGALNAKVELLRDKVDSLTDIIIKKLI